MSFLDRVTKAVSDTVDRGKKEVDQFMRIQKVKGEITQQEQAIRDAAARAQNVKQEIGDAVIARLRTGALTDPALQQMADRVSAIESEVAAHQAVIAEKRTEIARIEAEGPAAAPAVAPTGGPVASPAAPPAGSSAAAAPPPLPGAAAVPAASATAPPPLPGSATRACPRCGANAPEGAATCTACGANLS